MSKPHPIHLRSPVSTDSSYPMIHRDLSWLHFNERVLDEAKQTSTPLLERIKFLSISASNLNEFFMIRFASLIRSLTAAIRREDRKKTLHLGRTRSLILQTARDFSAAQNETLQKLTPELAAKGIRIAGRCSEGEELFSLGKRLFDEQVLPNLPLPEAYSPAQLSLLENLQIAAIFGEKLWLRIPRSLPPVFFFEEKAHVTWFFLDDLLLTHLRSSFNSKEPMSIVRLTRDADVSVDLEQEDPESIPDVVRTRITSRDRGQPTRLQYRGQVTKPLLRAAITALKIHPSQALPEASTVCLHGLWPMLNHLPERIHAGPGLFYPPLKARMPEIFGKPGKLFESLKEGDLLLHHPYDSFDAYVAWIEAACRDPDVSRVEQTVYRMDALSKVIDALKKAAKTKKIRVVIELRARFDELNNLRLADELKQAGVEVAFGFGKLKLHAKLALVTRKEGSETRRYTHISTGNYNATTARQYTDLAILTANPKIGEDARLFFDSVMKQAVPTGFNILVPAPTALHRKILSHIRAEIRAAESGEKARIVAKTNALVDHDIIENLYRASQAGVQIDLIVRGACSLVPGVKGVSENIRVISVVDRFLEHSRIYYFQSSRVIYLSSADWMQRNFFSRLELAFPVLDPKLYQHLEQVVIPTYVGDTAKAWELDSQGRWSRRASKGAKKDELRSQFRFAEMD